MRTTASARRLAAAGLAPAIALALAPAAAADYVSRSFTEAADPGLEVAAPLDEFRAVARARVIVPDNWRRLRSSPDRLRFITPVRPCRYRVTFALESRLAAPGTAGDLVAAGLPAAGPDFILDEGTRGRAAWRVVRRRGGRGTVRLDALATTVLTRRADIVPEGQAAWTDLTVAAESRPGDECHAGSWRDALGPQIGDALATARVGLRFSREGRGNR